MVASFLARADCNEHCERSHRLFSVRNSARCEEHKETKYIANTSAARSFDYPLVCCLFTPEFSHFSFAQVSVGFPLNLGQVEIDVQVKGFVLSLILCMCSGERAYIVNFKTYSLMVSLKRAL